MSRTAWLCAALVVGGCAEVEDSLGEEASELSVSSWSAPVYTGASADYGAAIATVGSTTIMVRSSCCDRNGGNKDLAWLKKVVGGWTPSVVIPGQQAADTVSLAAFNGLIYMVRVGESQRVYISHFNPVTSAWSAGTQLPYTSNSTPTIAAFQGQLWFVGSRTDTQQMWTATMSTAEVFSSETLIPNHFTSWRPTSAVFNGRLFVAHRDQTLGRVVYGSFNGSTWSPELSLPMGVNGTNIDAYEPVMAAVNGYLHVIYREIYSLPARWTYFDKCNWSPSVTIGQTVTSGGYSVTAGGPGLQLLTRSNDGMYLSQFTAPPTPPQLPTCGVVNP